MYYSSQPCTQQDLVHHVQEIERLSAKISSNRKMRSPPHRRLRQRPATFACEEAQSVHCPGEITISTFRLVSVLYSGDPAIIPACHHGDTQAGIQRNAQIYYVVNLSRLLVELLLLNLELWRWWPSRSPTGSSSYIAGHALHRKSTVVLLKVVTGA